MNRAILAVTGIMAALIVAIGVVIVVLVATGGDSDENAGNTQNGTPEDNDGDDGERTEGELRLLGPDPLTLDPAIAQDASSAIYIVEIFGGLVSLDPELQVQADLAAEIPTVENGGKVVNGDGTVTYTFHLRDGLLFHDRTPVTADDVKYSLERAADPETQSLVAEFFLGEIVGFDEKLDGTAEDVSGIRVVDEQTVEITIEEDIPSFLYKLTYPTAYVVDQKQVESDDQWTQRPNGTGPYELTQWRLGERIVLEANDHYHLGVPNVQSVRYLLAGSSLTLYEAGDIDVAGVGLDDIERVQDPSDALNAEYRTGQRLSIDYIGFNTNSPPFDDPLVRRAFAMAIDKEQIASAIFNDAVPVANGINIPGMPAYSADAQALGFDPEGARALLEQSEYGEELLSGGLTVSLAESGTGATSGPGTAAIVDMWRQNLGIEVEIQQAETATFFQDVTSGRYQAFLLGWIMDYPDEDNLFNLHFDSESPNNDTFYDNPDVDALLREALLETDAQRRIELYQQAEQLIIDDVPWIPLFYDRYHVLIKPYVQNYLIPSGIVERLRFITLDSQ